MAFVAVMLIALLVGVVESANEVTGTVYFDGYLKFVCIIVIV